MSTHMSGFQLFLRDFHHFVLAKLATSIMRRFNAFIFITEHCNSVFLQGGVISRFLPSRQAICEVVNTKEFSGFL